MNDHSLTILEFSAIRQSVLNGCRSDYGRQRIESRAFISDRRDLENHREYISALTDLLRMPIDLGLEEFPNVDSALEELRPAGSTVEAEDLGMVAAFLRGYGSLRAALRVLLSDYEAPRRVGEAIRNLEDLSELSKGLQAYIHPGGGLKEDIPRLQKLRDELLELDRRRRVAAEGLLGERRGDYRSEVPAARDGRLVLPLAAGKRTDGIVHGSSSSGQTVFVEPPALLAANNNYVTGENALQREIHAIIVEMCDLIRGGLGQLGAAIQRVGMWDEYLALAAYGLGIRGEFCEIGDSYSSPALSAARHPLLGKGAVPIDLSFGEGTRVIVLTGVNAGGKTVAMKTLGLLAVMNQWGLPIPASPQSQLPLFADVFIDSGDEQSIEGHLSTFSGHMRRVSEILSLLSNDSLVLLDELGTGTDPTEGGALGQAIIEKVVATGCYGMVTTHLQALKEFALSAEAVGNASMEFDESGMRPTYRVLTGIPGESRALDIAEASGMLVDVVARSRELREGLESDVSGFIRKYQAMIRENEQRAEDLAAQAESLAGREDRVAAQVVDLQRRENALREERAQGLNALVKETRRELEGVVRNIREKGADDESRAEAREFRQRLEALAEREAAEAAVADRPRISETSAEFDRGDRVRWTTEDREGTVVRKARDDEWEVQFGILRRSVPGAELETLEVSSPSGTSTASAAVSKADPEIDVRGLRLEDALDQVRRHVDAGVASGLTQIRIIHGVGEGILGKGIADYLDGEPLVGRHRRAPQSLGGAGATLADLQSDG